MPRSLLLTALLLLVVRVGLGLHEAHAYRSLRPSVVWLAEAEALERAATARRPLLYDFSADWCRPCRRMDREVFCDQEAGRFVNETFLPVRIEDGHAGDGLSDAEAAALRERFGVEAFPTLLVVEEGRVLGRSIGYDGRESTLSFLRSTLTDTP